MKRWLIGAMAVMMAVSLAACTPTTEKQKKQTTQAAKDTQEILVDKLIEYGVLTQGTKVLSFDIQGKEEDSVGTLDLNQAESAEGVSDEMFLTEIGNTFTENFELGKLKLKVNGGNYQGSSIKQGDNDFLSYRTDYDSVE